jgi:hypothetical protein
MLNSDRPFMQQDKRMSILQIIGAFVFLSGLGLLVFIGLYEFNKDAAATSEVVKDQVSSLAATAFFLVMMGIALLFPDMLKAVKNDGTSAMRVAVFMVVSVFVILCVKIYWQASFDNFKLDNAWAGLIAGALGSKALQSLGENKAFTRNNAGTSLDDGKNPLFSAQDADLPLHDVNGFKTPPLEPPNSVKTKKNNV